YEQYKAGRRAMPEDLRPQIEMVRELLGALSIPIYGVEGFEADDVIGTLARIAEERGHSVTMVSGDLDCLQLVTVSVEGLVPRRRRPPTKCGWARGWCPSSATCRSSSSWSVRAGRVTTTTRHDGSSTTSNFASC